MLRTISMEEMISDFLPFWSDIQRTQYAGVVIHKGAMALIYLNCLLPYLMDVALWCYKWDWVSLGGKRYRSPVLIIKSRDQ